MTTILETLAVVDVIVRRAGVLDVSLTVTPGRISVQPRGDRAPWVNFAGVCDLLDIGKDFPGGDFSTVEGSWCGCKITIYRPLRPEAERVAP